MGRFSIDSSIIIMPADIPAIAHTFQLLVLGNEFEADQPALDLFESDARRPRI